MSRLAFVLLSGAIAGCDRGFHLQGAAFEGEASSYEFLEQRSELRKRAETGTRVALLRLRLFEASKEGPKEWDRWHRFCPFDGDDGNFVGAWLWGGWGERAWERLVIEKEGFESVVIPGAALTRDCCDKFLLIRMKKLP